VVPTIVTEAFKVLSPMQDLGLMHVNRTGIVAYATALAWVEHWPGLSTHQEKEIIRRTVFIEALEPDRVIKQRKIAIEMIVSMLHS